MVSAVGFGLDALTLVVGHASDDIKPSQFISTQCGPSETTTLIIL